MNGLEFYRRVAEHEALAWLGCADATPRIPCDIEAGIPFSPSKPDRVYVRVLSNDAKWEIALESILSQPWEELLGVMMGDRVADIMTGITRIVGYYSFTRNWTRSKLAELADRHKGQYSLPEVA